MLGLFVNNLQSTFLLVNNLQNTCSCACIGGLNKGNPSFLLYCVWDLSSASEIDSKGGVLIPCLYRKEGSDLQNLQVLYSQFQIGSLLISIFLF